MRKAALLCVVLTAAVVGSARAEERKWWGNCGLTYNEPMGTAADRIEASGGFACGVAFRPAKSQFGVLGEIGWSDFNVPKWQVETDVPDELVQLSGHVEIWSLTVNGLWRLPTEGKFGFYVVGGLGAYRREISVETPSGYDSIPWCDPWWGVCYVVDVPIENEVASHSSTELGYNLGFGVTWKLTYIAELYVEARYTLVDTPRETEFVPIAVGVRF